MVPAQLTADSFAGYNPQARALAVDNLAVLQGLPLSFAPFLLREIIAYDWKFPAEQRELTAQLAYLSGLTTGQRQRTLESFARLQLDPALAGFDWVREPAQFLEKLSAQLWATHQLDEFRGASEQYVHKFYGSLRPPELPLARLGIVVVGQEASGTGIALFQKMRPHGVYFQKIDPARGLEAIVETLERRAAGHPEPYAHWYIDGGGSVARKPGGVTCVFYDELTPVRAKLAEKMRAAYTSTTFSAEALRSALAEVTPETVGLAAAGARATLERFQLSLLTEGAGTQIYSTTFVQWAAREALRRAQPLTLLARYTPRQRERSMNELLTGTQQKSATDAEGSLIDADMGAYYTWLNLQRLVGSEHAGFLVWFEGHGQALAIGPQFAAGTEESSEMKLAALLARFS